MKARVLVASSLLTTVEPIVLAAGAGYYDLAFGFPEQVSIKGLVEVAEKGAYNIVIFDQAPLYRGPVFTPRTIELSNLLQDVGTELFLVTRTGRTFEHIERGHQDEDCLLWWLTAPLKLSGHGLIPALACIDRLEGRAFYRSGEPYEPSVLLEESRRLLREGRIIIERDWPALMESAVAAVEKQPVV